MTKRIRLGFTVVYLARPRAMPAVERHLEYVERFAPSGVDWWIEAVAHGAEPTFRKRLAALPRVRLHGPDTIPPIAVKWGSQEHSHYLDALVRQTIGRGATHLCTLDDDSFPVREDWFDVALGHLGGGHAFAAAHRVENGDRNLPHPSFLVTTADFVAAARPRFLPRWNAALAAFCRTHGQAFDSGVGYALAAQRTGRNWAPLLRSNVVNDHFLLAGLYGDIAFHVGGVNWGADRQIFRSQHAANALLPQESRRARLDLEAQRNHAARELVMPRMTADMDGYLAYLRGQATG